MRFPTWLEAAAKSWWMGVLTCAVGCTAFERPTKPCGDGDEPRACTLDSPVGECTTGTQVCSGGFWGDCIPSGGSAEVCDGKDNDCDTKVDEDDAAESCSLDHTTTAACVQGECRVATCEPGFDDCDERHDTGCEVDVRNNLQHCGRCDNDCQWECNGEECRELTEVALGDGISCALLSDRSVTCWGDGSALVPDATGELAPGELVIGTKEIGRDGAFALAVGGDHACVLALDDSDETPNGRVVCWGNDAEGQLGRGSASSDDPPVRTPDAASNLSNAEVLAAGPHHTCARVVAEARGESFCWGLGSSGQLGDGSSTPRSLATPTKVDSSDPKTAAFALGDKHTCAMGDPSDGAIYCWGDRSRGQLGNGQLEATPTNGPSVAVITEAQELIEPLDISGRRMHTCAVSTQGDVYCWGDNSDGQLGLDPALSELSEYAVKVSGLPSDAVEVAAGARHTCARLINGEVWCWGSNDAGQLGAEPAAGGQFVPVQVEGLARAKELSAGDRHNCALHMDGSLSCWGANGKGQLGAKTEKPAFSMAPVDVSPVAAR